MDRNERRHRVIAAQLGADGPRTADAPAGEADAARRVLREVSPIDRRLPPEMDEGNVDRYVLSDPLAVDRRTAGGFLAGIMDKTLFPAAIDVLKRLRAQRRIDAATDDAKENA